MENPIITMSAITGKPTTEKIFEYLKSLKDNGVHQAMLYPRSGCELEYLSDEWFDTIEQYIKSAEKLGMRIWLYDDFNWPSGDAAGRVTAIEEYRLKSICIKGESLGKIGCYSRHNASIFGEKFFPDLLCDSAVDYFIECTHQKYYEKFGHYFGNVIKGLFTDEPAIGYCCTESSIPYYNGMEADYKVVCGRDFYADIKNNTSFFCQTVFSLIADKFNNCFIKKIHNWCDQHGLLMTGHLLGDNDPVSSTTQNGNILKCLSSFKIPGVDELHTDLSSDSILPLYGATEYAAGEYGAMAELFGIGPCDLSYSRKRCAIFLAACFKINHFFMGCSHLDMRGNAKITDYFNTISADQPDFSGMRLLSCEAQKAAHYASKDFVPDVYVKYPAQTVAKNYSRGIKYEPFMELINTMSAHQIQWKYILPGDKTGDIPVIDFDDNLEYVYNNTVFTDASKLCTLLAPKPLATNLDGSLPKGIFVRIFEDNTFMVLNLFADEGFYLINNKKVFLTKEAVYISDHFEENYHTAPKEEMNCTFNLHYNNPNMTRAIFPTQKSHSEIVCKQDTTVIFAVRSDTSAFIDGKKIAVSTNNNHLLSHGFKPLYGTSETINLEKGTHVLSSEKDFKYLPSVFIIGDFYANDISADINRIEFAKRAVSYKQGEYFKHYGTAEFSIKITVPIGAKAIEISGTKLYTKMFVNDKLVGEKIRSPYVFEIDENLRNKTVELKIIQYSNISPIFGNLEYFSAKIPNKQWPDAPIPKETNFGFKNIEWILEE